MVLQEINFGFAAEADLADGMSCRWLGDVKLPRGYRSGAGCKQVDSAAVTKPVQKRFFCVVDVDVDFVASYIGKLGARKVRAARTFRTNPAEAVERDERVSPASDALGFHIGT